MESFFLAETIKYLYLIFDETNFLHSNGEYAIEHRSFNSKTSNFQWKIFDFHLNRLVFSRNGLRLQHRSSSDRHRCDGLLFAIVIKLLENRRKNLAQQRTNALVERRALRSRQFSCNKYKFQFINLFSFEFSAAFFRLRWNFYLNRNTKKKFSRFEMIFCFAFVLRLKKRHNVNALAVS